MLQDVLNDLAGAPRPIEIKLFGDRYDQLAALSTQVASRIQNVPGLVDLFGGVESATPNLLFRIDRDASARAGRTAQDVVDELQAVLGGLPAGSVRRGDRLSAFACATPTRSASTPTRCSTCHCSSAITTRYRSQPSRRRETSRHRVFLLHEGLQPVVIVTADHEHRDLGSVMNDVRARLAGLHLPPGYRVEIGGQAQSQRETFVNLGMVLAFGLVLTLLVLVAQFRRVDRRSPCC